MHLGRFHAVIYDLAVFSKKANLIGLLQQASSSIAEYASSRDEAALQRFKSEIAQAQKSSIITDEDLFQPFAQQVISELNLNEVISPEFPDNLNEIMRSASFDPNGLASALEKYSQKITEKLQLLKQLENSLDKLEVEFERVSDSEAEIGFMLPREVVGNKLSDLSKEFDQLNKLARAIAELSGDTEEYEPTVRTIASSWWQIFLDLTPEQIGIWVIAIERIVNLFKSNLEIKNLSNQLKERKLPEKIIKAIESEVEQRVKAEISKIAQDIRKQHQKGKDAARLNELETQLRQGLSYMAKRLNQGMQVEINLAIPDDPKEPIADEGEKIDNALLKEIEARKKEIAKLTELRERARSISVETRSVGENAPLLIENEEIEDK